MKIAIRIKIRRNSSLSATRVNYVYKNKTIATRFYSPDFGSKMN